jgi:hypothetical protein
VPSGVNWDVTVLSNGTQQSSQAITDGGARFELWTIKTDPLVNYLLDSRYVGAYVPIGNVQIRTGDKYVPTRTRADQPIYVSGDVSGIRTEANAPVTTKSVILTHHVQSYGVDGTGTNINPALATLVTSTNITQNSNFAMSSEPGFLTSVPSLFPGITAEIGNRRGEDRFTVYSMAVGTAPRSVIASKKVQIWPTMKTTITGITEGCIVKPSPPITVTYTDAYPNSTTYTQIHKGLHNSGFSAGTITGSSKTFNQAVPPAPETCVLSDWANTKKADGTNVIDSDGVYTVEILSTTPFGTNVKVQWTQVNIDYTSKINAMITTIEK